MWVSKHRCHLAQSKPERRSSSWCHSINWLPRVTISMVHRTTKGDSYGEESHRHLISGKSARLVCSQKSSRIVDQ